MGEDKTFRAMLSAARKVSRNYKLPGKETVRGTLLDNCFENHIKNQSEKLLDGADIYRLHVKGDGEKTKDTNLINILDGGVYLPVSVQKILYCTGHITGGHKKDAIYFSKGFFHTMNELDPEKKLVDLHMFDGSRINRNSQKILKVVYPMLSCIVGA